jgi:signal transduction histidine kinase
MELKYSSKRQRMLVRDDGCGLDEAILGNGKKGQGGLAGMRERAHSIGGRLRVASSASAGTEIELTVPGKIAFEVKGTKS